MFRATAVVIAMAAPAVAEVADFTQAGRWQVDCTADRQVPDPFPVQDMAFSLV